MSVRLMMPAVKIVATLMAALYVSVIVAMHWIVMAELV